MTVAEYKEWQDFEKRTRESGIESVYDIIYHRYFEINVSIEKIENNNLLKAELNMLENLMNMIVSKTGLKIRK